MGSDLGDGFGTIADAKTIAELGNRITELERQLAEWDREKMEDHALIETQAKKLADATTRAEKANIRTLWLLREGGDDYWVETQIIPFLPCDTSDATDDEWLAAIDHARGEKC